MIDLKTVKEIKISEGSVTKITDSSGVVLWEVKDTGTTAQAPCYYVADNVSDLPQSLYQAEYAQIGIHKFLITDYHWNVNSKAVVEFEINSDTNEFGKYGRILAIEGEEAFSSYQSAWNIENTTWQTKPFGSTSWNRSTVVANLHQKYVGEYAETGLTIDGTVITATTPSTSITANTSHYVCIGGYNTNQREYLDGKIYSVKIYESGTLVRDIVPLTNGLFYDKLSKKVYAAGAGGVCDTGGTSTLLNEPKYDMAYITSEKSWYALNNKSQWEKYGVIEAVSSLDNLTAYDGKLVYNTTDKHEYKAKLGKQYNETMPSKPSDYVFSNVNDNLFSDFSNIKDGDKFIIYEYDNRNTKITDKILAAKSVGDNLTSWNNAGLGTITDTTVIDQAVWTFEDAGDGTFYIHNNIGAYWSYENHNTAYMPTVDKNSSAKAKVEINTTRTNPTGATTFMPVEHNSGGLYGLNDLFNYGYEFNWFTSKTNGDHNSNFYLRKVNNGAYTITTREISWADQGEVKVTQNVPDGYTTYPVSYDEYDAPNLNYTECANEAAMKALSCPYEGMKVKLTDTGKKYKFTYNSTTSQYEWDEITSSLDVDLNNQWVASTKTLEGYKVYMSNSNKGVNNGYASMKFKFEGIPDFKIWINSYAESNYDYTVAWNMDVDYPTSNPGYNSTGVKANTRGKQYNPTNITAFTEVDYSNDGGEHFVVVTYRKDSSANENDDRGYVAIKFTLISTTWVVSATEFIKKDDKYYQRLNEVGTYIDGSTALTGNYKEGNELPVTYKQGTADDYMIVGSNKYYKKYAYVTPVDTAINTGDYVQGDYIGEATPSMKVTYTDNTEKAFYGLTSIDRNTDSNKTNAKEVIIYDGVTSIGEYAFSACRSLTGITIPDSVKSIGDDAFYICSSLTGITISNSVTSIGEYAFAGCTSLATVTIQNSTSKIYYQYYAFGNIPSNARLFVPSNLLSQYQSDSRWTGAFGGGIYAIGS